MAKLPFIVEPKSKPVKVKIGNEETGIFEIERRGYLSVAEKSFVEGFTQSSGSLREIVKISNQISLSSKISREDAYKALMNVMSGQLTTKTEKEIAEKYQDEIAALTELMTDIQSKRVLAIATIMLQSRIDSEWTIEDTLTLDPVVLTELEDLYNLEESKIKPEEVGEDTESVKEILGK